MRTVKITLAIVAFAALTLGMYFGPRAFTAHASSPSHSAGYVDADTIHAKLARNAHSVASKGGAFLDNADISGADIVSAHQEEVK